MSLHELIRHGQEILAIANSDQYVEVELINTETNELFYTTDLSIVWDERSHTLIILGRI